MLCNLDSCEGCATISYFTIQAAAYQALPLPSSVAKISSRIALLLLHKHTNSSARVCVTFPEPSLCLEHFTETFRYQPLRGIFLAVLGHWPVIYFTKCLLDLHF